VAQASYFRVAESRGGHLLLVDGGGIDGGSGAFFVNHGADVHAVGTMAPLIDGYVGCVVIRPDGSRVLARAVPTRWGSRSRISAAGSDSNLDV
jgi:hypothetical protein